MIRIIVLLVLLVSCQGAMAAVMVLVQGYLGDADSWRRSGVTHALGEAGWRDGGHLRHAESGVVGMQPGAVSPQQFYTLALPTEAPLLEQLRKLKPLMEFIRQRHAGETLYLVGHSAGGVLARLYMVNYPEVRVAALITIASPHLGTASAEAGLAAGEGPFGLLAPLLGAEGIHRSRGLYHDLAREQAGNLLYWLNRQPHPQSRYISIVRRGADLPWLGDLLVPDWSQDMNNVIMLRGRGQTLRVRGGHNLSSEDGRRLVALLLRLQHS